MRRSAIGLLVMLGTMVLFGIDCKKKEPEEVKQAPAQLMGQAPHSVGGGSSVAGIHWAVPGRWSELPPRQMRYATYNAPAAVGDPEGGECGVFFFGSGQGGSVDMNIDRWIGQFEDAGKPSRSVKEVNGLKVTFVEVRGTYVGMSGPMMPSQGKKENYRLLGAIVEAPEGSVFFKFTGPQKTVAAAEADFNALTGSFARN
jgi:hypothetical protein